ncbi:MAG: hypothetical protein HY269_07620 [Deltaproteobacteria bacterium]|nr:hypothetical protein [Deltaproteobacteria bacterium]
MAQPLARCKVIKVLFFRGDRGPFGKGVYDALRSGLADPRQDPTRLDCLLWAGHTGVSFDLGKTIYGFNPDGGRLRISEVINYLESGNSLPGVVIDDTGVFQAAAARTLEVLEFDIIVPPLTFDEFEQLVNVECKGSRFRYDFPNTNGDCNCATWIERLGLPLVTGRMSELVLVADIAAKKSRQFGACTP